MKFYKLLVGQQGVEAGATLYPWNKSDCGCASDDSRILGVKHVAVCLTKDGSTPFFTVAERDLQAMDDLIMYTPLAFLPDCFICKEIEAMKVHPVINLPAVYVPRETEPCCHGMRDPLAAKIVHVNDGGTVNLVVWDRYGIQGNRPNVLFVQFTDDGPIDGSEYCRIDPSYIGDHRTLNAALQRVNELQNQVTALTMAVRGEKTAVTYFPDGEPLGKVVTELKANAGTGNDVADECEDADEYIGGVAPDDE